jgi:hypothetical protein
VVDEQLARFYSSTDGRDTFSGTRISSRILSGVNLAPQRGHGKMGVKLVGSPSWGSIGGSGLEHGVSFRLLIQRISRKYLFLYLGLINYLLRNHRGIRRTRKTNDGYAARYAGLEAIRPVIQYKYRYLK